jgi:hypothetical protein
MTRMKTSAQTTITQSHSDPAARVAAIDWTKATNDLDAQGCAVLKGLLTARNAAGWRRSIPKTKTFAAGL